MELVVFALAATGLALQQDMRALKYVLITASKEFKVQSSFTLTILLVSSKYIVNVKLLLK